jgi:hypothetical protein
MAAWKLAYKMGWATKADLDIAVTKGQITQAQEDQILAG